MIQDIISLFERDLNKLGAEIKLYQDENQIWVIKGEIKNCAGNLCYHLLGNLNHFIGAVIGKTGYIRNRDEEFSKKNIPQEVLIAEVDKLKEVVSITLKKLSQEDLASTYPIEVFGSPMTTYHFLLHLYGHLNYHLGQINYHRRLTGN